MRFCYNCSKLTPRTPNGQPLFCGWCGRSYDTKFCPRLHPSPRSALVCAQCGSKELTMPQPKVPFWLSPLLFVLTVLPGLLLWTVTVLFALWYVYMLLKYQQLMFQTMLVGLLLGLLWLAYLKLPETVRKAVAKRLFQRSNKERSGH